MLALGTLSAAPDANPTTDANTVSAETTSFGEWTIVDEIDGPDRVDGPAWRVRAERATRSGQGWKLQGSVRAASDSTIVAAEHARLTRDGLTAEHASIYVDQARLDTRLAELDARSDRIAIDRPGHQRPQLSERSQAPQE